jgi:hypothetical protein
VHDRYLYNIQISRPRSQDHQCPFLYHLAPVDPTMPPKPPVCSLHIYHTSTTPLPHLYLLFRPAPKTPLERPRHALLIRLLADVLEMMHVLRLLSALIQIVPRPFAKTTSASASARRDKEDI